MKKFVLVLCGLFFQSCSHQQTRTPDSSTDIFPQKQVLEMVEHPQLKFKLRSGYSLETAPLKACVIYLQGLADSVRNHQPYFAHLNSTGYRVLFFDYPGQGGSEGSMNQTRIKATPKRRQSKNSKLKYQKVGKYFEVPELADFFWGKYQNIENQKGQSCKNSPKFVIGWSTGGLAAYRMANEKRADAVVLIAPGIHPKWMVGESAQNWNKMIFFKQTITEKTLTRNRFEEVPNPHLDPISPKSPARVPLFAMNLIRTAEESQEWKIDPSVSGLVFLSGQEDSYVDREATIETLKANAPHFIYKSYDGALHELDNEIPEVAQDVHARTVEFFDSILKKDF